LEKLTSDQAMTGIKEISLAAYSLWKWVLAIEKYAKAYKDIEPKRVKVNASKEKIKK